MKFIVSCDHKVETYRRTDIIVDVSTATGFPEGNRYYCTIVGFGCSKSYAKPETAITCMLHDHGCFDIRVKPLPAAPRGWESVEGGAVLEPEAMNEYRRAGQEARLKGDSRIYGCHFGPRSTRAMAAAEFQAGWDDIDFALGVR